MCDMLVKLYELPPLDAAVERAQQGGVRVRLALSLDKPWVTAWVRRQFPVWVPEVEAAFARQPVGCFVAQRDRELLGFACHEATCRNFFGPIGVDASVRRCGIGRALLLAALHAQRCLGYAYSVIGAVEHTDFYVRTVGAVPISGSRPGVYRGTQLDPHDATRPPE